MAGRYVTWLSWYVLSTLAMRMQNEVAPVGQSPVQSLLVCSKAISMLPGTYYTSRSLFLLAFAGNDCCLSPKSKLEHLEKH